METTESNKLIADFMGLCPLSRSGFISDKNQEYYGSLSDLQYHKEWNWLMPVVKKCMQTGDNTDEWDALYDALSTVNETNIYEAVEEFIKYYNEYYENRDIKLRG